MIKVSLRRPQFALYGLAAACLLLHSTAFAQDELDVPTPLSFPELLQQGQQQLDDEEFDAALQTFSRAVELSKNSLEPRAYLGRAKVHVALEDYQNAIEDFKSAEEQSPGVPIPELLYARGTMYLELGQQFYGVALPDLQAAYEDDRGNTDYLFSLGKIYALVSGSLQGAGGQAVELLTRYLETDPENAEAIRLRGRALATINQVDEALADLNHAIELDPDEHETYATLGFLHLQQRDYEKAIAAIDEAIANYTSKDETSELPYSEAYITKSAAFEELGKKATDPAKRQDAYTRQIETCNELLDLLPDTPNVAGVKALMLFRRGIGQRLQGQFGPAVKSLTEAIEINPEMGEAYFRRAICFNEMGEEGLALGDLNAAQALNFEDPRAYLWEGLTHAQKGEYRDAIRAYNEAISYSNRYVDAYLNRGHAYYQLGEFETAIDSFNECIRLQPAEASHFYKRGICFKNLGKDDQALQSYIKAIQFDERFVPAYDVLIPELESQGRKELANQYRQKRAEFGN
ncbi:MAG: tetratricopeptide repeat protein [Aeoliella sp.]